MRERPAGLGGCGRSSDAEDRLRKRALPGQRCEVCYFAVVWSFDRRRRSPDPDPESVLAMTCSTMAAATLRPVAWSNLLNCGLRLHSMTKSSSPRSMMSTPENECPLTRLAASATSATAAVQDRPVRLLELDVFDRVHVDVPRELSTGGDPGDLGPALARVALGDDGQREVDLFDRRPVRRQDDRVGARNAGGDAVEDRGSLPERLVARLRVEDRQVGDPEVQCSHDVVDLIDHRPSAPHHEPVDRVEVASFDLRWSRVPVVDPDLSVAHQDANTLRVEEDELHSESSRRPES